MGLFIGAARTQRLVQSKSFTRQFLRHAMILIICYMVRSWNALKMDLCLFLLVSHIIFLSALLFANLVEVCCSFGSFCRIVVDCRISKQDFEKHVGLKYGTKTIQWLLGRVWAEMRFAEVLNTD